jgi:SAM-dependent methyltransferase
MPGRGVNAPSAVARLVRRGSDWVDLQWSALERSLRSVAPQARGRLLDVGCGDKPYASWFLPHVRSYIGIEQSSTFGVTSASGRGGPDIVYGGGTMPFRDGSFDTVLSVQVLEHTPRPQALVNEMARVLAPDGLLILTAPFQFRLHEEPHDYFRYSPHGLRTLCEAAGLEILETLPQGSLWSVLGHKLNTFLAFRMARIGQVAQTMGKLGHEGVQQQGPRWWTLPLAGPAIVAIAGGARALDRLVPEPTESLGFLILARRRKS